MDLSAIIGVMAWPVPAIGGAVRTPDTRPGVAEQHGSPRL